MAIDQLMLFYSANSVVVATNSDIIPLSATRQFGTGARPLYIDGRVTTTFSDSGSNSTGTITLQTCPYEAFNSSITNTVVGTIATNAAVGSRPTGWPIALPSLGANQAFLRLTTANAGGDFSTGAMTAWLTPDPEIWTAQPVGWTGPSTS